MKDIIEKYNTKDYRLGWEMHIPQPRNSFFDTPIQLNQDKIDPYGCGYFASIGSLTDLLGLTKEQAYSLGEKANKLKKDYWYIDWVGMYAYKAVDLVRDIANDTYSFDINSHKVVMWSTKMYELLEKGYSIMTWYRWNSKYNDDRDDGVLDWKEFWEASYWHMIRLVKHKGDIYVIDNYNDIELDEIDIVEYSKEEKNIYKLKHLQDLIDNEVFFRYGFIYIIKDDMDKQDRNIEDVKKAYELGITDNEQNIRDVQDWNYTQSVQTVLMVMRWLKLQGDIQDLQPLN